MTKAFKNDWFTKEHALLRSMHAEKATWEEIHAAIPRHSIASIRTTASKLGLRKAEDVSDDDLHPLIAQLRAERRKIGMSQTELAVQVGCDRTQLLRAEKGRSLPGLKIAYKWAAALGLTLVLVSR